MCLSSKAPKAKHGLQTSQTDAFSPLPTYSPPTIKKKKKKRYSPELDRCHSNSIAESHYSTPHYIMAEEVGAESPA